MTHPLGTAEAAWWLEPLPSLLGQLGASERGLTDSEAADRLARFGPNDLAGSIRFPLLRQLLRRFRNPLVLILLAAALVSLLTGEAASFVMIITMVLISVLLDFVQEYRAGQAALALRQSMQLRPTALRNGAPTNVPASEIVPGDIVALASGSLVPADGRLILGRDLFVNQALLSGEPFPVEKHSAETLEVPVTMEASSNVVFMGTSVVSGTGRMLVCRTGKATSLGQISESLRKEPPPTAFDIGIRDFGLLIMRITVVMVLFVILVNTVTHKPLLQSFLFAIALAVGLTPELLPMVVSVTLARGALRMATQNVIVKRLAAIQNLGSMQVLCTDKTGTLTEATVRLEHHVDSDGAESSRVLQLAYLNGYFETGIRSPLDEAILAHGALDVSSWTKIDEAPFDFDRRRVSVLIDDGVQRLVVVKGAPEHIIELSTHYELSGSGAVRPFDADARHAVKSQLDGLGAEGLRVLAVAFKRVGREHDHAAVDDETQLVFSGFVAFLDPPKVSARDALAALSGSGIALKILTGDNELVTRHLCRALNIPIDGVLTGEEISHLSEPALQARVEAVNLFCRVNPMQKNRIILALKSRGRVVGYLGDGINDAPALHSADVSLSVDTAVDVAKDAADLILLKRDLNVLHDAVLEGRRTFVNIHKYIMMGTSSSFGNVFSMAAASVFLPFLPMLPAQVLLNNVLYDLSEVAIPLDHVDADEIASPQRWDMALIRNFMWVIGSISSAFDLLTFYILLAVLNASEAVFQTGWFLESLATQVLVIFVIRTRGSPLNSRPHPALVVTSFLVLALAIMLPFTGLRHAFGFEAPQGSLFAVIGLLVVAYLVLVEMVKRAFYVRFARSRLQPC